ncbi:hypothetical protein WMY93_026562 [Mugilogobius chulae]|uniref:Cathepsin propeptide inhibitor domain-containing protein n=1 Tax=Mugilogobius chulae TaxID=88201 RepID=A0AAW0N2P3_9GOBI
MADQDLATQWEEYKKKFDKKYDPEEDKIRRGLWEANLKYVEIHNREYEEGIHTYTIGINQFSDMKPNEMCCGCHH